MNLATAGSVLLAALASFAILVAVFVPLERAFPARPDQRVLRRELVLDGCFFAGQYLVWNGVAMSLLAAARQTVVAHLPPSALGWSEALPTWLRVVLAIALGDVLVYWFHRACHAFEPLWRFHAIHHSSRELDFLAAHREHPVDGVLTQLCANLPAFVIALPLPTLAGAAVFRGMWAIFVHSNVRIPLGPLRWLLGAPELHHWHHAKRRDGTDNFANLAPWIDVLFGTHHLPTGEETYELGNHGPRASHYLGHLLQPLRGVARRPAASAARPCRNDPRDLAADTPSVAVPPR